jgi:hypothetical protein
LDDKRDEKRADLRTALRELAAAGPGDAGPHTGPKRLIAYRQGTLPAAEREAVQEHLSLCARCTGLLRELRDFEAASAGRAGSAGSAAAGPESLREEAWASLLRRLPGRAPGLRPVTPLPRSRAPYFVYAAAAALLLAVAGLSLWAAVGVRQERQRIARLERRLEERDSALATVQRSLAETGRRLDAARGRIQSLETEDNSRPARGENELAARVAGLTAELETLRRQQRSPDRLASVDVSVAPRFVLRGEEPAGGDFLLSGGAVNPVRTPPGADRLTVALDLADAANAVDAPEVRLELTDRSGEVLWSGRLPGSAFVGDDGTSVTFRGLGPGRYRLRIEGLQPDRTRLLAEYLLDVQ